MTRDDRSVLNVVQIYELLRERILDGSLAPGEPVTQLTLAPILNVSRTKLREALRMLESEGLLESTPNKRSRVSAIDVQELDSLYGSRIMLEGLAALITVPLLTASEIEQINDSAKEMETALTSLDAQKFESHHTQFHSILISKAPRPLGDVILRNAQHAERYRRIIFNKGSGHDAHDGSIFELAIREHQQLAAGASERDSEVVVEALSAHYVRTAVTACSLLAPEHDPQVSREAYRLVTRR